MNTLIYLDGGNIYRGTKTLTATDIKHLKEEQKENGSVGYMTGYRYWNNEKENVLVFFNEVPKDITAEQNRRRENGFKGAKWYSL